jgi:hypothetical protein
LREILVFGWHIVQVDFQLRNVPVRPTIAVKVPAMSIQTALSVGEPVKNLETSELKELVALNPAMISATPPMRNMREMILFIITFQ